MGKEIKERVAHKWAEYRRYRRYHWWSSTNDLLIKIERLFSYSIHRGLGKRVNTSVLRDRGSLLVCIWMLDNVLLAVIARRTLVILLILARDIWRIGMIKSRAIGPIIVLLSDRRVGTICACVGRRGNSHSGLVRFVHAAVAASLGCTIRAELFVLVTKIVTVRCTCSGSLPPQEEAYSDDKNTSDSQANENECRNYGASIVQKTSFRRGRSITDGCRTDNWCE